MGEDGKRGVERDRAGQYRGTVVASYWYTVTLPRRGDETICVFVLICVVSNDVQRVLMAVVAVLMVMMGEGTYLYSTVYFVVWRFASDVSNGSCALARPSG